MTSQNQQDVEGRFPVNIIKGQHMKDPSSLAAVVMELGIWLGAKAKRCGPFVELLELYIGAFAAIVRQGIAEPTAWAMEGAIFTMLC